MKRRTRLDWFLVVFFFLSFLVASTFGTLVFAGILGTHPGYGVGLYVIAFVCFALIFFAARSLYDRRLMINQLTLENLYTLGQKSTFFNLFHFENRVRSMKKSPWLRKKKQFIVAFTFAPVGVSSNPRHNEEIAAFNYAISCHLESLFHGEEGFRSPIFRTSAFCFHRGEFILYLFANSDGEIKDLCSQLAAEIYAMGQEKHVRILVQPFFGITETHAKENITFALDNAQIARNYGEDSFDSITFYHSSFRSTSSQDDVREIESALNNEEFVVYYQPKFSLKERRFVSSEALVRWDSPKYGLLTPSSFIGKAESSGLISRIDLYVFEHALKDISEQLRKGRRVLPVSVNFSLYEFFSPHFLDMFVAMVEKYHVPPTMVEVEITETTSQANQFISVSIIKKLKDYGVRVLMDDFGIGYSGIDNLRKIPFDAIKIDKSFTDLILEDDKTRNIVRLIVELGHMSDLEVIIEGVDSAEQVDVLRRMKMDTIQGFYYSKPLPLDRFEAFLKDNPFEKKGGKQE